MKYFINPQTIEELKQQYKKLAMHYHPDMGGSTADMQAINAEYESLFAVLKNKHTDGSQNTTTDAEDKANNEEFKAIIEALIHLDGINIEIIGSWIWVTGNTFPHREKLKELHFTWCKTKTAWTWHEDEYKKHYNKQYSLEEIRKMWGSETVNKQSNNTLSKASV
jgi:curved DNA-binding protein CbpA